MKTVKWRSRIRAEWSPIASALDALVGILAMAIFATATGSLRIWNVPWGWTLFTAVSMSVTICAVVLLWRKSVERREEATDVLRSLAFEAARVTTIDEAKQWAGSVATALVGANCSFLLDEWSLLVRGVTDPNVTESEALQTVRRSSYWLRAIAPTIKASQARMTNESTAAALDTARREYRELLASASNIVTKGQAQGWARQMGRLVLGLRSLPVQEEFDVIVRPLFGPDKELDVSTIIRAALEYLEVKPLGNQFRIAQAVSGE